MSTVSALSSGVLGIQRGLEGLQRDASKIASAEQLKKDSPESVAEPLVHLIQDKQQVQASARVVKAVDDTIGTLLDTFA